MLRVIRIDRRALFSHDDYEPAPATGLSLPPSWRD